MKEEMISGTVIVSWTVSEKGLGIGGIQRKLTKAELAALYDRIEDLVRQAFRPRVTIWVDGEDKPPVDVFLEASGYDIEIHDGPVNGMIADLRDELESDSR